MPSNAIAIRLDEELQQRLKALGKTRDRSAHHLMKEAIADYVAREEAIEAEKQVMRERYAAYELTGEYVTHHDMKNWAKRLGKATGS